MKTEISKKTLTQIIKSTLSNNTTFKGMEDNVKAVQEWLSTMFMAVLIIDNGNDAFNTVVRDLSNSYIMDKKLRMEVTACSFGYYAKEGGFVVQAPKGTLGAGLIEHLCKQNSKDFQDFRVKAGIVRATIPLIESEQSL